MVRATPDDSEREITLYWTRTVEESATLDFDSMAKALGISRSALKEIIDETGDIPSADDIPAKGWKQLQEVLSHEDETIEVTSMDEA